MSHELRTPLNVILGFSQLLTRSPNLSSEQLASLQTIGRSGEHLLALINDVLEFSKIEAGKIEVKSERFDLHGFLLGLEEMFRLRAGQKGLALKFILEDDVPPQIRADKNKLRQVLINLLGNAVKFTDAGSVTLHVRCREQKQEPSGRCLLRITVADTGIGISPEDKDKIFDAFFQTGGDRSPLKGTGLGLAISDKFVELMGGELAVESTVAGERDSPSICRWNWPMRWIRKPAGRKAGSSASPRTGRTTACWWPRMTRKTASFW